MWHMSALGANGLGLVNAYQTANLCWSTA